MFEVLWTLDDAEWEQARKRRAETSAAVVNLRADSAHLYKNERGPVNISLLDFADFAASVLARGFTNTFVEYDQLDDDRQIRFDAVASAVQISASDSTLQPISPFRHL